MFNTPQQAEQLDPFTYKILTDVIEKHATATDHGSGHCCQLAAQYKVRVEAHQAVVIEKVTSRKSGQGDVAEALSKPMATYIISLYKKCPKHLLSPLMREQADKVSKHEEISRDAASALIDAMKSVVYGPKSDKDEEIVRYVTAPMVGFLRKLLADRDHNETIDLTALELLPFQVGRDMIDRLKQLDYKANVKATQDWVDPEEGLYVVDGVVYKVQRAVAQGSGAKYAKVMDKETGTFSYVGKKPFALLTADNKMTLEQAGAYGKLYGRCIRCQRDLTDEFSIANGLGKICYEKMRG
jgi:hypothetical protein